MWTKRCGSRGIKKRQKENSVPRMWDRKKAAMVKLKSSGIP